MKKQTSDEALVASPIPATASRGLAPVGGAGDLQTAAVAGSPGPAAPSNKQERAGSTPARLPRPGGKGDGSTPSSVSGETNGTAGPAVKASAESGVGAFHRKPQRRELSFPLAALAYTWAAIERRGRA